MNRNSGNGARNLSRLVRLGAFLLIVLALNWSPAFVPLVRATSEDKRNDTKKKLFRSAKKSMPSTARASPSGREKTVCRLRTSSKACSEIVTVAYRRSFFDPGAVTGLEARGLSSARAGKGMRWAPSTRD